MTHHLLPLLLLAACTDPPPAATPSLQVEIESLPESYPAPPLDSWLVLTGSRADCNTATLGLDASLFVAEPLFETVAGLNNEGRLHRYCQITLTPGAPAGTDPALPGDEQDVVVVDPQGAPPPDLFTFMADRFDRQAGMVDVIPSAGTGGAVPVTVIDTAPTTNTYSDLLVTTGNNAHGQVMANIIHRLTCPGTSPDAAAETCPADLRARLALNVILNPSPPPTAIDITNDGGDAGSISNFAKALHTAANRVSGNHILNLSVAWHPMHGGGLPSNPADGDLADHANAGTNEDGAGFSEDWPLAVQAAFDALTFARCKGALVFAAAGNASAGQQGTEGLKLPAAWSTVPSVDLPACNEVQSGMVADNDTKPPVLLHAVGSTQADGSGGYTEGGLSRPLGTPMLTTDGVRGISSDIRFDPGTGQVLAGESVEQAASLGVWPLTGTSTSTAVATAAAVLAWHANPTSSPEEIYTSLVTTGAGTGLPLPAWITSAGGWSPGGVAGVRHLRACEITATCSSAGAPSWSPPSSVTPVDLTYDTPKAAVECTGNDQSTVFNAWDDGSGTFTAAGNPCPAAQFYDASVLPGVMPEPKVDPCPPCTDTGGGQLYIDVRAPNLMADLTVVAVSGGQRHYFAIPPQPDTSGRLIRIADLATLPLDRPLMLTGLHVPSDRAWQTPFVQAY